MTLRRKRTKPGVAILLLVCLSALSAFAVATDEGVSSGRVPKPVIPQAQGDRCVADTAFMRRNHMDLLDHQRDETVLEGLRDEAFSLKDCISCHAVKGPGNMPVTVSDPKHFCRSCHDYASVNIDCFQCHASRPESAGFPVDRQFSERLPGSSGSNGSNQR